MARDLRTRRRRAPGPDFEFATVGRVAQGLSLRLRVVTQIPLFYRLGYAAPLRGLAPIASLERLVVYRSWELIVPPARPRARPSLGRVELLKLLRSDSAARGRGPEGMENYSSCYARTARPVSRLAAGRGINGHSHTSRNCITKQMTIPNASSCTRVLKPSFS